MQSLLLVDKTFELLMMRDYAQICDQPITLQSFKEEYLRYQRHKHLLDLFEVDLKKVNYYLQMTRRIEESATAATAFIKFEQLLENEQFHFKEMMYYATNHNHCVVRAYCIAFGVTYQLDKWQSNIDQMEPILFESFKHLLRDQSLVMKIGGCCCSLDTICNLARTCLWNRLTPDHHLELERLILETEPEEEVDMDPTIDIIPTNIYSEYFGNKTWKQALLH